MMTAPRSIRVSGDAPRTFETSGEVYAWALGYVQGAISNYLSGVTTKADLRAAEREADQVVERTLARIEARDR